MAASLAAQNILEIQSAVCKQDEPCNHVGHDGLVDRDRKRVQVDGQPFKRKVFPADHRTLRHLVDCRELADGCAPLELSLQDSCRRCVQKKFSLDGQICLPQGEIHIVIDVRLDKTDADIAEIQIQIGFQR